MASIKNNKVAGSGRFQTLQNFMSSNQDADMGKKIGETMTQKGLDVQKDIGESGFGLKKQSDATSNQLNQGRGLVGRATTDPSQFMKNKQDTAAFGRLKQGDYNKAQTRNVPGLQKQTQDLKGLASQGQNYGQRMGLLRDTFGLPSYSTGAQRSDSLLLQNQPDQIRGFQQAGKDAYTDASKALTGLSQSAKDINTDLGRRSGFYTGKGIEGEGFINEQFQDASDRRIADIESLRESSIEDRERYEGWLRGDIDLTDDELLKFMDPSQAAAASQASYDEVSRFALSPEQLLKATNPFIGNLDNAAQYFTPEMQEFMSGDRDISQLQNQINEYERSGNADVFGKDLTDEEVRAKYSEGKELLQLAERAKGGQFSEFKGHVRDKANQHLAGITAKDLQNMGLNRDEFERIFEQNWSGFDKYDGSQDTSGDKQYITGDDGGTSGTLDSVQYAQDMYDYLNSGAVKTSDDILENLKGYRDGTLTPPARTSQSSRTGSVGYRSGSGPTYRPGSAAAKAAESAAISAAKREDASTEPPWWEQYYTRPDDVTMEQAATAEDVDYLEALNQINTFGDLQSTYGTDKFDFDQARTNNLIDSLFGQFDLTQFSDDSDFEGGYGVHSGDTRGYNAGWMDDMSTRRRG